MKDTVQTNTKAQASNLQELTRTLSKESTHTQRNGGKAKAAAPQDRRREKGGTKSKRNGTGWNEQLLVGDIWQQGQGGTLFKVLEISENGETCTLTQENNNDDSTLTIDLQISVKVLQGQGNGKGRAVDAWKKIQERPQSSGAEDDASSSDELGTNGEDCAQDHASNEVVDKDDPVDDDIIIISEPGEGDSGSNQANRRSPSPSKGGKALRSKEIKKTHGKYRIKGQHEKMAKKRGMERK